MTTTTPALRLPTLAVTTRERALAITGVVLGLLMLFLLGVKSRAGEHARFVLAPSGAAVHVPTVSVSARWTCWVLGVIVLALSGWLLVGRPGRRQRAAGLGVIVTLFLISFLAWASVAGHNSALSLVQLGNQTLVQSVPIILGALCGVLCERSGVINIAIEGQFLLGAFTGAIVGAAASSLWLGLFGAALAGGLLSLVLAFLAIRYFVDQVILGVVLNVFALGLTNFLYDRILVPHQNLNSPKIFGDIKVPGLSSIPIIGPIFFDANVFLYITYALLIVLHLGLFRTRWGLRLRAVGEHPTAADTVGINVRATRYRAVVLGGLIAGIAGASFTIGSVGGFGKDITSGKGYIALAALIFGRWSPGGALAAALVFGFADALQSNLGVIGTPIPSEFLGMLPYLVTVLAVAGLVGKVRAPGADGKPYVKS
ncbi:MAG TPA: ABC transporter permease [Mycobacteriales bacterium]|nr:ABC transporter permease [Mycobacteriales bacterium]